MGKRKRKSREAIKKLNKRIKRFHTKYGSTESSCSSQSSESDSSSTSCSRSPSPPIPTSINTEAVVENPGPSTSENMVGAEVHTFVDILGKDPTIDQHSGPELMEELVLRWTNYVQQGLDSETKTEIGERWHIAKNCPALDTPQLNDEILAFLPSATIRRDGFLKALQSLLGKGLTALGAYLTRIFEKEAYKDTDVSDLVDAGKIFAEAHHRISQDRRYAINPFFNDTVRKVAATTKISTKLYGDNFGDHCKTAKNIDSIAKEIKAPVSSKNYQRQNYKTRLKPKEEKFRAYPRTKNFRQVKRNQDRIPERKRRGGNPKK